MYRILKAILELLGTLDSGESRNLDATNIKVHQDASTGDHQETYTVGQIKGGVNSKTTRLVDSRGWRVRIELVAVDCADVTAAEDVYIPAGK